MSKMDSLKAAAIVRDAGGCIPGRTRLQKVAYLLSVAGLEDQFKFTYWNYGPFSETLAVATRQASLFGLLKETEMPTNWGGIYSTYEIVRPQTGETEPVPSARLRLAKEAAAANAVELELAATAVFLAIEKFDDPWGETVRRKPEKADNGRIERARILYRNLCAIETPVRLPEIA